MKDIVLFADAFKGSMDEAWQWLREAPEAHMLTDDGLRIRALPGTLWGERNDARNILLRPAQPLADGLKSQVTVSNHPVIQGEQGGLIWLANEDNYVKLVKECLDGLVWIVLASEVNGEGAIQSRIQFAGDPARLSLTLSGDVLTGHVQAVPGGDWQVVGTSPALATAEAQLGICVHGGPEDKAHWAELLAFTISS